MLFNTLANLRVLIGVDPARAQTMLDRLIAFLRATLAASRSGSHPLADRVRAHRRLPGADGGAHGTAAGGSHRAARHLARRCRCRRCCCSRWWKTPSSTGWSPRSTAAASRSARAREGDALVLDVRDTGGGLAADRRRRRQPVRPAPGARAAGRALRRSRLADAAGRARRPRAACWPVAAACQLKSRAMTPPRALIAEDEPLLLRSLSDELRTLWPELQVVAAVGDGDTALREALQQHPAVCFLDIRMPGLSGLEVAQALAEDWPAGEPFPLLVFITAYDQYAVQAFDAQAVDYLVKPVAPRPPGAPACSACAHAWPSGTPADALPQALEQLRALLAALRGRQHRAARGDPGRRGQHRAHGAGRRRGLLRGGRQVRARDHRRSRAPDPHVAARIAAAARSAALLASAPRHRGARALDRKRLAPRIGQGHADACASAPSA